MLSHQGFRGKEALDRRLDLAEMSPFYSVLGQRVVHQEQAVNRIIEILLDLLELLFELQRMEDIRIIKLSPLALGSEEFGRTLSVAFCELGRQIGGMVFSLFLLRLFWRRLKLLDSDGPPPKRVLR